MSLRVLVLEAIYLVRQLKADQYNIYSYAIFFFFFFFGRFLQKYILTHSMKANGINHVKKQSVDKMDLQNLYNC